MSARKFDHLVSEPQNLMFYVSSFYHIFASSRVVRPSVCLPVCLLLLSVLVCCFMTFYAIANDNVRCQGVWWLIIKTRARFGVFGCRGAWSNSSCGLLNPAAAPQKDGSIERQLARPNHRHHHHCSAPDQRVYIRFKVEPVYVQRISLPIGTTGFDPVWVRFRPIWAFVYFYVFVIDRPSPRRMGYLSCANSNYGSNICRLSAIGHLGTNSRMPG